MQNLVHNGMAAVAYEENFDDLLQKAQEQGYIDFIKGEADLGKKPSQTIEMDPVEIKGDAAIPQKKFPWGIALLAAGLVLYFQSRG